MHISTIKSQFKAKFNDSNIEIEAIKKHSFGIFSIKGFQKLKTKNKVFSCVGDWNGGECEFGQLDF
jgi:hypothetical protein